MSKSIIGLGITVAIGFATLFLMWSANLVGGPDAVLNFRNK